MSGGPAVLAVDAHEVAVQVAQVLTHGGVVVLPTDTVYGVAALPGHEDAVLRLFHLKGRSTEVPLAVLCATARQALALADTRSADAVGHVAARWWPGPLTLVLHRRPGIDLHLGDPPTTVGLRVPDHRLVHDVASLVGPIATTSANRHGEPTATTAAEAVEALGRGVDLVIDGGTLTGTSSTVLDATSTPWQVLRPGPIPEAELLADEPGTSR